MPPTSDKNLNETSPLMRYCPQRVLDSMFGFAGLIDPDFRIKAANWLWDETMIRAGKTDLTRSTVMGSNMLDLVQDNDLRKFLRKTLVAMSREELKEFSQIIEFNQENGKGYAQLSINPVWEDGLLVGYLIQGFDVSKEHGNRLALMDREQRLKKISTENKMQSL